MSRTISKQYCLITAVTVSVLLISKTLFYLHKNSVQRAMAAEVYAEIQMISWDIQTYLWEHPAAMEDKDWMDESLREVVRSHCPDVLTVSTNPPVSYLLNPDVAAWVSEKEPSPVLVVSPVKTLPFDRSSRKVYLGITARGEHVSMEHLPEWTSR